MKRRLILLVIVIAFLAGFGTILHSPPSIVDAVTGATPKAKKEVQESAQLEGNYVLCMNTKGEDDSPMQHYEDTIKAACGLADPNAVWDMTQAAPDLVRFCHHSFQTLILHENICCGCLIKDDYSGQIIRFISDAVIIATGGMHGLFGDTTGSLANTGEVTAELFRLGVPMANLEMIQHHPTTVELGRKRMLISEAARGEGGRLYALRDNRPWYFMEEKYPELGNLMPRDIASREIWKVSRETEVFLDMTEIPEDVMRKKLSGLVDDCLIYLHKDIRKEPIPVLPGIHYFMGGIYVDEQHRTAFKNLYAAGECCAQYHGANRLGGNSLLGALYGGRVAAKTACEEAKSMDLSNSIDEIFSPKELKPYVKKQLNSIMLETLGVLRNESLLQKGSREICELEGTLPLLGLGIIESALARKEA